MTNTDNTARITEVLMYEVVVGGKPHYFKTRQEALAYARNYVEQEIYRGRKEWPLVQS